MKKIILLILLLIFIIGTSIFGATLIIKNNKDKNTNLNNYICTIVLDGWSLRTNDGKGYSNSYYEINTNTKNIKKIIEYISGPFDDKESSKTVAYDKEISDDLNNQLSNLISQLIKKPGKEDKYGPYYYQIKFENKSYKIYNTKKLSKLLNKIDTY
mgnify:FL=1